MRQTRQGFTLVELLVVIVIIGILVGLLMSAIQSAREAGRMAACLNNFKQVGLAMQNYEGAHEEFPPGMRVWDGRWAAACGEKGSDSQFHGFSWSFFLLPYMDQGSMIKAMKSDGWYSDAENRKYGAMKVPAYLCPSDSQAGELVGCCSSWQTGANSLEDLAMTNMAGVADSQDFTCNGISVKTSKVTDGAMGNRFGVKAANFKDGLSNTLLVGEVTGGGRGSYRAHFWVSWNILDTKDGINGPFTIPGGQWAPDERTSGTYTGFRDTGFSSYHPGGAHFILADATAHFISENVSQHVIKSLTTRGGLASGDPLEANTVFKQ